VLGSRLLLMGFSRGTLSGEGLGRLDGRVLLATAWHERAGSEDCHASEHDQLNDGLVG